jgi:hypothetical protein
MLGTFPSRPSPLIAVAASPLTRRLHPVERKGASSAHKAHHTGYQSRSAVAPLKEAIRRGTCWTRPEDDETERQVFFAAVR